MLAEIQSRGDVHRFVHNGHNEVIVNIQHYATQVVAERYGVGMYRRWDKKRVALINMVSLIIDVHADVALRAQNQGENAIGRRQTVTCLGFDVCRSKAT